MARVSWARLCEEGRIAFEAAEHLSYEDAAKATGMSRGTLWRRAMFYRDIQARAALYGRRRPSKSRDWIPMRHSTHGRRPPGSSGKWLSPEEWGGETYHQGLAAQGYKPLDGRWYSPEEYPLALAERRARLLAEVSAAETSQQRQV